MKKKRVLLVSANERECDVLRRMLCETYRNVAVNSVNSGRLAIDSLMNNYQGKHQIEENPDVIIISNEIRDIPADEVCDIILSYYRFRNIKFYLLADPIAMEPRFKTRVAFHGYINRPVGFDTATRDKLLLLSPELDSNTSLAWIPLVGILQEKVKLAIGALSTGAKVAVCGACIGSAVVATPGFIRDDTTGEIRSSGNIEVMTNDYVAPSEPLPIVIDTPEEIVIEQPEPIVIQERVVTPDTVIHPAPPAKTDTVPKKNFRIGVRSAEQIKP